MWVGVPQSYYVDEFAEEGIMLEGAAGPPDYLAAAVSGRGDEHRELMLSARHLAQFGVMVSDSSRGEVRPVRGGRFAIRYSLDRDDVEKFRRGLEVLAEIFWAAGARELLLPVHGAAPLGEGDPTPARLDARDLEPMAFHPLGTARAGADPATSVVGPELRVHGTDNVWVCDGSAVPSSLGVNPQITIMSLATRLAFHLLGQPAPADEPQSEDWARPKARAVHAVA